MQINLSMIWTLDVKSQKAFFQCSNNPAISNNQYNKNPFYYIDVKYLNPRDKYFLYW